MTYSEDGLWFWNGTDWIPAPPKNHPNQPVVNMQDSVIGGDVNYNPQVIHNTQNIVNNNVEGGITNPTEDLSGVANNAYECGKKALKSLGLFVILLTIGALIGLIFEDVDSDRISPTNRELWLNDEGQWVSIDEKPFDKGDYYPILLSVMAIFWLFLGVYIFTLAGSIKTFNRVREHYPSSPLLEQGDKGKNMHDVAKYAWLTPLVIVIIAIIIGLIVMKIAAEMEKHNNRN